MNRFGFVTSCVPLWRSSAAKISTETVGDRVATLAWTGNPISSFTVFYSPVGAKYRSRRLVAHPRVHLRGLKPGVHYDVRVVGNGLDASTSFRTVAIAESPITDESTAAIELPLTEISRLEIRVGKIIECEKHPDADSLYVEKVDIGEEEPRTIVSGLVKFIPLEKMINRNVLVLCNLKPRTMRGTASHGMLLCVSNDDRTIVDPLAAPKAAPLGELITFEGHKSAPIDPSNRATKAFDKVAGKLKTSEEGIAMFEDVTFSTSAGPCFSPDRVVGAIS